MKRLFLTFTFAIVATSAMFMQTQDAHAWWDDDDDYWDRPWYGGGPWYGGYGYPYGGYGYPYGGYPYGGYGYGYPYGGYYGGGYGYPYGGYGYGYPQGTADTGTQPESTTTMPANPAYPAY